MLTPVVVEIRPQRGRAQRQQPRDPHGSQSAVYVPYRRRSATGKVRVATGVAGREER